VIGVDFPVRRVGRGLDRRDGGAGFRRREQGAEPSVGEPPHPPQPGRRRSAEPDVQRLSRQRTNRRAFHREERPVERHVLSRQHQPQQRQRLVEHRAPLPGRHREQRTLGGEGGLQTEHRQQPAGRQSRERGELLGDQDGMASGQHRDPAASLETRGLRQRERDPGERIDRRSVHVLRQPQRVDTCRFQQGDRGLEFAGRPGRPQ
jgi:hypothetical protein